MKSEHLHHCEPETTRGTVQELELPVREKG